MARLTAIATCGEGQKTGSEILIKTFKIDTSLISVGPVSYAMDMNSETTKNYKLAKFVC